MLSIRFPANVRLVDTTSSPCGFKIAVKKSFFSRMKGDIEVRVMSASISRLDAFSAPLISSTVNL